VRSTGVRSGGSAQNAGMTGSGLSWAEFEAAAPEIAARGREVLERWGFVFAATIRSDGTPRVSPVDVRLVGGQLILVMIGGSHKVRDLRRDGRVTVQSPVTDPEDPGAELKLRGHVKPIADAARRGGIADAVQASSGWRPSDSWAFLELVVTAVAHLTWTDGDLELLRWDQRGGASRSQHLRLDIDASRYRDF
jgi:hypothetical protein